MRSGRSRSPSPSPRRRGYKSEKNLIEVNEGNEVGNPAVQILVREKAGLTKSRFGNLSQQRRSIRAGGFGKVRCQTVPPIIGQQRKSRRFDRLIRPASFISGADFNIRIVPAQGRTDSLLQKTVVCSAAAQHQRVRWRRQMLRVIHGDRTSGQFGEIGQGVGLLQSGAAHLAPRGPDKWFAKQFTPGALGRSGEEIFVLQPTRENFF